MNILFRVNEFKVEIESNAHSNTVHLTRDGKTSPVLDDQGRIRNFDSRDAAITSAVKTLRAMS